MGQRLNIEIKINGELIANSYFHWSAYTGSSIELVKQILSYYDDVVSNYSVQRAVSLLELTGAGIQEEELQRIVLDADKDIQRLKFKRMSHNRNQGFIHVLQPDMDNTRDWDEGRVTIDIGDDTIIFDVLNINTVEYLIEECEWDEDDLPPHVNLDQLGCEMGAAWSFDQFFTFVDLYEEHPGGFQWTAPDGEDMVTHWVE